MRLQLTLRTILQGAVLGAVTVLIFPKWKVYQYLVATILYILCLSLIKCALNTKEGFAEAAIDDGRMVRYGDTISLFTMKNSFLKQGDATGTLTQSATLTRPEDLPSGSYKQLFILEDPANPAGPGNANPVLYGSTISLVAFNGQYVAAADSGSVILQDNRADGRCVFTVEGDNINATSSIRYGDAMYLKSTAADATGVYITAKDDGTIVTSTKGPDSHLSVQDKYGQGLNVNWAKLGRATQSSTYQNYNAYYAVDGKLLTFSSTNSELNPWWEIALPKEIYVDRIIVKNRANVSDDVSMRLSNFSIIIKDAVGVEISRKSLSTASPTSEFSWNNVYHIGRSIRIQLNDTSPQYLNMGEVQVFGMPVNYSVLLNKPIMSDLTTYTANNKLKADATHSRVFEDHELPLAKDDMSIAFWVNIDPKTYAVPPANYINVLIKGNGAATDSKGTRSPALWLTPNTPNLKVSISTVKNLVDGIDTSSIGVPLGKPTHIVLTVSSGVSTTTGWKIGNFRSGSSPTVIYVIFNPVQKRYWSLNGIDSGNYTSVFGKVDMLSLDDLDAAGFQNLGVYDQSSASPNISLYVNGRLSDTKQLSAIPLFNTSPLVFNADKLLTATFSEVKYTNYAMTPMQIHGLAVMRVTQLCKTLVSTVIDASKATISIGHSELPAYEQQLTLGFWAKISTQTSSNKTPIVVKGSLSDPEFGVILSETGSGLIIPVRTLKYPVSEGIDRSSKTLNPDTWTHFAVTIGDNIVTFYINGSQADTSTLSKRFDTNYSALNIGGFVGQIQNCKMCNYCLKPEELPFLVGSHPDTALNQALKTAFDKAGCTGYPYGIDMDPGAAQDLKALLAAGRSDQVDATFANVKKSADAYVQGTDASTEAKANSDMCYGDIKMMNLPQVTSASGALAVSCLPTAPFTCPSPAEVNDFDIRTHKDFYKYVNVANVKPAPTLGNGSNDYVKISDLSNPQTLAKLLSSNPDIAKAIATDLANVSSAAASSANTSGSGQSQQTPTAAQITAMLQADPSSAAEVIAGLVKNTSDPSIVKSIAASLVSSGSLNVADLVKTLPPAQMNQIIQSIGANTNTSTPDLISMTKNDSTRQQVLQKLVRSGQLKPADLLAIMKDTPEFRSLVSSSCAAGDEPIQNHPDFIHYIAKASVPCYGCELDDP